MDHRSYLKHKVANNKKVEALYEERRKRKKKEDETEEATQAPVNQRSKILLRIARVATGASVRWKGSLKANDPSEGETGAEGNKKEQGVKCASRLLACTRCRAEQETKEKQLKVNVGFRATYCKNCGKQERVHSHRCSCDAVWHQCPVHRLDPFPSTTQEHLRKGKTLEKMIRGKKQD